MEKDPLFDVVAKLISEKLDKPLDKVTPAAHFINDLSADSLDLVELEMALEDKYDLDFRNEETKSIVTVQDLVNLVKSKTK